MRPTPALRLCILFSFALASVAVSPLTLSGQERRAGVRDAYFQALAEHFQVPEEEVAIVGNWEMAPEEVPVVLFLSQTAGVSPDVLIGLRRRGRSWLEVAGRFGLGVHLFHLPLPQEAPLGVLARVYQEFRTKPTKDWNQIELNDAEVVYLVNLRVLSEQVGVPVLRVLESRQAKGNFLEAFADLLGRASA